MENVKENVPMTSSVGPSVGRAVAVVGAVGMRSTSQSFKTSLYSCRSLRRMFIAFA